MTNTTTTPTVGDTHRDAEQTLAELRRKLTFWEKNLKANYLRYVEQDAQESEGRARTQLDVINAVFEIIDRD